MNVVALAQRDSADAVAALRVDSVFFFGDADCARVVGSVDCVRVGDVAVVLVDCVVVGEGCVGDGVGCMLADDVALYRDFAGVAYSGFAISAVFSVGRAIVDAVYYSKRERGVVEEQQGWVMAYAEAQHREREVSVVEGEGERVICYCSN